MIASFTGEHEYLSNFYAQSFMYGGHRWPTAEHAYQAAKAAPGDRTWRHIQLQPTPGAAKKAGRAVRLRDDWEIIKVRIMHEIIRAKFPNEDENPLTRALIVDSHFHTLVEGNTWGDNFWGASKTTPAQLQRMREVYPHVNFRVWSDDKDILWVGDNYLGRILMQRAGELGGHWERDEDLFDQLTSALLPVTIYS